jgi:hypothetical protein
MTDVWRKSSYSTDLGACTEVAALPGGAVAVRDSKNPGGGLLRFTVDEWRAFLSGVKAGEFDSLA